MSGIPLNIDFQQILLHLLNVVILFGIMYLLLYKPVKKFMDKRKQEYLDRDKEAEDKLREAEALKAECEARLKNVDSEIQTMKENASEDIAEKYKEFEESVKEEADTIIEHAQEEAQKEHDRILEDIGDIVTEMSREAAAKLIFDNPSQAYDSFLNAADEAERAEEAEHEE